MSEPIDPQAVLAYAEQALPNARNVFLRETAVTTINQLRRAIEAGEDERARELAAWLKTEDWA